MDTTNLGIFEINELIRGRKASCQEIVQAFLARAREHEDLNAYTTLREKEALAEAKALDKEIKSGREVGPLTGVPYAVKDAICTAGTRATGGAKILDNYVPPFSATVIGKIQAAGGIILGKNNCDAYGHGNSNENSSYGPTKNPWDPERVPGGSSGGSAAALAAGTCAYSIAEDTGGSIRQPASFCGVTGLKPSYGRNSRYGIMPMASSLDTVGPMARSAKEIAALMEVMAGQDPKDSTTMPGKVPQYAKEIDKKPGSFKVGIPKEYFEEGLDAGIRQATEEAIEQLGKIGAKVRGVSLPMTKYAIAAYYVIVPSEDSSNLARLDGVRYGVRQEADSLMDEYLASRQEGFPQEVKRRLMIGTYALSHGYYDAYYKKAQQVRTLIVRDFDRAFQEVDALLTPISPIPPFKIGELVDDPLALYLADAYTVPASVAGLAGLALPVGFSDGLPVGMQLLGPQGGEARILQLGHLWQQETDWHKKTPFS